MSSAPSHASPLILVHGSWMGGWSWSPVAERLRSHGHEVQAPTLTGLERDAQAGLGVGLGRHAAEIVALVDKCAPARPVIIGYSYGGAVATEAAATRPGRIAALVVLDGFVLPKGCSILGRRPDLAEMFRSLIDPEQPALIQPPPIDLLMEPGEEVPAGVEARLRPMPLATHDERAAAGVEALTCPATYVHFARFGATAPEAEAAGRLGWTVHSIDAGHLAILTHPDAVAEEIRQAMRAAPAPAGAVR